MNKFTFILASVFVSGLVTGVISAILSGLYSFVRKHADHPHQLFPTWAMFLVLGFVISACVTLFYSMYCVFYKGDTSFNVSNMVRTTTTIGLGIVGLIVLYAKFKN
jgi:hypothetical protein